MAGTVIYLASRAGGYAHGQEIVIDGGYTAVNPSRAWVLKPYVVLVVSNLNDVLRGVVVLIDPFSTRILCHRITNLNDLYTSPFSQIYSFAFDSSEVCRHEFSLCLGQGPAKFSESLYVFHDDFRMFQLKNL